jgi:predicted short-subunit dehydrogenase-like oxidoreductase (DUF2520 family)
MTLDEDLACQIAEALAALAEESRHLPPEQREQVRAALEALTHRMNHTVGVVIGANSLLRRLKMVDDPDLLVEMTGMIASASDELRSQIEMVVKHLNHRIELE